MVTFNVSADDYGRFMGRYSEPLAVRFADAAGVMPGQRALDVGCGPGALTAVLVERLGAAAVTALDPSPSFVAAARARFPDVPVLNGAAEQLPFEDAVYDVVLAQLVVHFMADPARGVAQMRRVARPGGTVAACVWDHAGGTGPLSQFWETARDLDAAVHDESGLAGARQGHLFDLFTEGGLRDVEETSLQVDVVFDSFEEWWEPFTLGVGPAGGYVATLDAERRSALRARCEQRLPAAPFRLSAAAWAVRGTV